MSGQLTILKAGPSLTVQDWGWTGTLSLGLSRGGAADTLTLIEGAALLDQPVTSAAIELAGFGGDFVPNIDTMMALTGAPMVATLEGASVPWNSSFPVKAGQCLSIGSVRKGLYGYLHVAGGIQTAPVFDSRSTHLIAGIGARLHAGDTLPILDAQNDDMRKVLTPVERCEGGLIRVLPSAQTDLFTAETLKRFEDTPFERSAQGNRQGVRLEYVGDTFATLDQLSLLSEVVMPGDIQMTGDGTPYILLPDCQTTGGYPRIGSVLPDDLPKVAQAAPGTLFRFQFLTQSEGVRVHASTDATFISLRNDVLPLIRDPRDIPDLLEYNLISGVTSARRE